MWEVDEYEACLQFIQGSQRPDRLETLDRVGQILHGKHNGAGAGWRHDVNREWH